MSQVPEDGNANVAREAVERTARRAHAFEAALIGLACFAVLVSSVTAVGVGLGNRHRADQERKNVAAREEATAKATAAAVQVILDYIDRSFSPHRLRNEAENMCQVELFAGSPSYAAKGVGPALTFYDECVLRRSGNTAPPPVPPNPLTTTTTTTERIGGRP